MLTFVMLNGHRCISTSLPHALCRQVNIPEPEQKELGLPDGSQLGLNVWDLGGQRIYLSTHPFFMTRSCVYLLLWNSRTSEMTADMLRDYVSTVATRAPAAPILMVGTHAGARNTAMQTHPRVQGSVSCMPALVEAIEFDAIVVLISLYHVNGRQESIF